MNRNWKFASTRLLPSRHLLQLKLIVLIFTSSLSPRQTPTHTSVTRYRLSTFFYGATAPSAPRPPHYRGFTITLRHTILGSTPSGQVISRSQKPLPDNTHSHKRQTSMSRVGFEPAIPAGERPQTNALDLAATGTGLVRLLH